jgi:glutamate/tyrosine decarboxylase-like PLP-dependent enzyme
MRIVSIRDQPLEQEDMRTEDYAKYFLDPEGNNLDELIDSSVKALNALRIWWQGVESRVSKEELERKKANLAQFIQKRSFNVPYQDLEELLGRMFGNVKFNQNNFINIHPSPFLPSLLASFLVSIQNPNNITEDVSPATTQMEKECIGFYKKLIGYPLDAWGTLVSDGTLGNLTALLVARDEKYGGNNAPEKMLLGLEGLYGKKAGIVLTTANVHYSIEKAIWILGLGTQNLIKVPVTVDERRMREEGLLNNDRFEKFSAGHSNSRLEIKDFYEHVQEPFSLRPNKYDFEKTLKQFIESEVAIIGILLTAGTTQSGTIENVSELIGLKTKYEVFFHVDAAIGGYALSIPEIQSKLKGLEKADSITIDGHKLGFLSYPCASIIFREQRYRDMIEHTAPYLQELSPTIEGSRPGSPAAACWLAHNMLKEEGYRNLIGNLLKQTKYLARRLKEENNYQIYHKIDLNTLVFGLNGLNKPRKKINSWNLMIAERLNSEKRFCVNSIHNLSDIKVRNIPSEKRSELVDIKGIRVVIMNPYTSEVTIDEFVDDLKKQRLKIIG